MSQAVPRCTLYSNSNFFHRKCEFGHPCAIISVSLSFGLRTAKTKLQAMGLTHLRHFVRSAIPAEIRHFVEVLRKFVSRVKVRHLRCVDVNFRHLNCHWLDLIIQVRATKHFFLLPPPSFPTARSPESLVSNHVLRQCFAWITRVSSPKSGGSKEGARSHQI
jgi:hypothetical protein